MKNTKLQIRQGLNAKQEIDFSQIKASILEDVFKKDSVTQNRSISLLDRPIPDIGQELKALYPDMKTYAISNVVLHKLDATTNDTLTLMVAGFSKKTAPLEQVRLRKWLKSRLQADSVQVIIK